MKTVVLRTPGTLRLEETDAPASPGPGEALVRIHRIGICGTDLHAFRGRQPFFTYPRILGHELGVEVIAVGPDVSNVHAGDRCAVEPYLNCGTCSACRRGRTNCCEKLQVLGVHIDGGMREFLLVPAGKLHSSEKLSLEQLALIETLGIGAHAVHRAALEPGEAVLVLGSGPIGLSVITFAKAAGTRPIVLDVNENRLAFCHDNLGIEHTLLSSGDNLQRIQALSGGDLPTAVFDATGNPQSMMNSFGFAANGGRIVFVGLFQGDVKFHDPEFHRKELTILATRNSTADDFRRIIRLVEEGVVDTTPWITHRAGCEEMLERFPSWLEPGERVVKAVVEF